MLAPRVFSSASCDGEVSNNEYCILKNVYTTSIGKICSNFSRSPNSVKCEHLEEGNIVANNKIVELPFNRAVFVDGTWNQSKAMYGCLKGNNYPV